MSINEQLRPATKTGRYSLLATQVLQSQKQTAELFRERLFSVAEARAALGGLHQVTIYRLIHDGELRAVRMGKKGHFKIPLSEIRRLRGESDK